MPVWHSVPGPYPAERLGISREEQMMDPERSLEANFQAVLYYQSDMVELMPPLGSVLVPLGTCAGQGTVCRQTPAGSSSMRRS